MPPIGSQFHAGGRSYRVNDGHRSNPAPNYTVAWWLGRIIRNLLMTIHSLAPC